MIIGRFVVNGWWFVRKVILNLDIDRISLEKFRIGFKLKLDKIWWGFLFKYKLRLLLCEFKKIFDNIEF